MDEAELLLWRIERLQAAVDELEGGNLNAFGRRMGWADGSYVGQMLRGARPITEKLVRKIEDAITRPGWFDPELNHSDGSKTNQLRAELLLRDVPDHVLLTFLEAVRAYPPRRKTA